MRARITIEMMGSPPEFVESSLKKVEEKIRGEYRVYEVRYEKPVKVGDMYYSVFFEMELEFKDIEQMFGFILDYGPSTIEVLESKPIKVEPLKLQNAANDTTAILHELLKQINLLKAQIKLLQRKALEDKVKLQQALKEKETTKKAKKSKKSPKTSKKSKKKKGNK